MKSPDGNHSSELIYENEIRFGPAYYKLSIDGVKINNRIFGHLLQWSEDSRYLATEEWLTTDYQKGPITRVAVFDTKLKRFSEFKIIEKGFAEDFRFEGDVFVYKKHYYENGVIKEVEVDLNSITNWEKINL